MYYVYWNCEGKGTISECDSLLEAVRYAPKVYGAIWTLTNGKWREVQYTAELYRKALDATEFYYGNERVALFVAQF